MIPRLSTLRWLAVALITSAAPSLAAREPVAPAPVARQQPATPRPVLADAEPVDVGALDEAALRDWSGASLGWDVHGEAISLFKRYSIGERSAWYSGQGAGGGLSVSLHFRPAAALSRGVLRWLEFELGVGNSTHFVRWEEGERDRPHTDFVDNQTSAIIGAHIASGRWSSDSGSPWSGAVLGLAWMPTYVHFFGNDDFASGGKLHHAGVRLSVDWARVSATAKGRVPGLRAFLTWLPYVGSLPTSVSAGVGCVFY
jgi:hypothetical protein